MIFVCFFSHAPITIIVASVENTDRSLDSCRWICSARVSKFCSTPPAVITSRLYLLTIFRRPTCTGALRSPDILWPTRNAMPEHRCWTSPAPACLLPTTATWPRSLDHICTGGKMSLNALVRNRYIIANWTNMSYNIE